MSEKINELNLRCFSDSLFECKDASTIVSESVNLVMSAMDRDFGYTGMTNKFSMNGTDYDEKNGKIKHALLSYAAKKAGISQINSTTRLAVAFDNPVFVSIYNSIVSETLLRVMIKTTPSQIMGLANIDEVNFGDSKTYEIDTKGLPVAQRNSYQSNVSVLDSYASTPITVTPKVYSTGSSMDYTRILANGYDFGKEMARVAMSLIYAQFKLVVGILFDSTNLTGTPLYQASFVAANYVLLISWLQMLNTTNCSAFGTIPAFNAMGVVATTNYGFQSQDEMVKKGFLGQAYGINNITIDQATDLSAPFITANVDALTLIPNNKVLLISNTGDKPVKLVRENFIRVYSKEPKQGSIYNQVYTYSQSFDAGLATQAHYAIQGV